MNLRTRIGEFVRCHEDDIFKTLTDLVAIQTVNPPGRDCREFVECISALLGSWKVDHQVLQAGSDDPPRFCVVGKWGPGEPGMHFHGHYDVVPAQSTDQFRVLRRNGRIYGRGTSDMKGGIVSMLYALRALQECGTRTSRALTFSLVPDEETGGRHGIRFLAAKSLLPRPAVGTLMPEPTSGVIWNACRGAITWRVRINGQTAHVGLPHQGVNAFEGMARVTSSLIDLKARITERQTRMPMTPAQAKRSVIVLGGASASGTSYNTVPADAWFSIDRRFNPEESLAEAKRELNEVLDRHRSEGLDIEVDALQEGESCEAPADTQLGKALSDAIQEVSGKRSPFELCPGILETRFFTTGAAPGYSYGPGILEVSHGPDEYVEAQALLDCTEIYALVAARLC
jgi:succinyl-diaminopimelate desuccinylase